MRLLGFLLCRALNKHLSLFVSILNFRAAIEAQIPALFKEELFNLTR